MEFSVSSTPDVLPRGAVKYGEVLLSRHGCLPAWPRPSERQHGPGPLGLALLGRAGL